MRLLALLLVIIQTSFGQVSAVRQKALNSYVDYANQSAEEVTSIVKSIIEYYPKMHKKNSWGTLRYICPVQMDEYYWNTAWGQSKSNATISPDLNQKLKDLRTAAEKIDEKCKVLDTYHKLEDYKQDNFAKAEALINELQLLLVDYKNCQAGLQTSLEAAFKKLISAESVYRKADVQMAQQVARERSFLDLLSFNLKSEIHTGWPVDKLGQSILETDAQVSILKKNKAPLQYPASSMWTSFQSSLTSILEIKRKALDEYNVEAKKTDVHGNDVYLSLINYFNGTLVSDYNTFVQFSERDKYYGLKTIKYVPLFEIRTQSETIQVDVKPFNDAPRTPVVLARQKTAISKAAYDALNNYIDFINESWRQIQYMQSVLSSFSSSAAYYKTLESFERRAGMSFDFKNYQVPLSDYQKAITDSKVLPPPAMKSLNEQAEVLLNILKEIEAQSALLENEVKERRYEKDRLEKVYQILERQKKLLGVWDERKEQLYADICAVYDAFPPSNAASSWYISGTALRTLSLLDHDALFLAKKYYQGDSSIAISTDKIDQAWRDVIAREYDNMKGIQKIGRNNGLCPYTPYEDLPETSKQLSEELKKLKPAKSLAGYSHPYHTMVYLYNDIVDDHNKFCDLSTGVFLLKTIKQPELFTIKYPEKKTTEEILKPADTQPVVSPTLRRDEVAVETSHEQTKIIRDTQVLHDTVYIEKRDTVYVAEADDNLRSMEGYATNNMVLLLDISGSMNSPEKLPLLKQSVLELLSMMRQEDEISIVIFSAKPKVLLNSTSFKEEEKISRAINDLKSSGKTDGNAALKMAYKVADENYIRGGNNRIILATDGEFPVSEETIRLIAKFSGDDIFLTIFDFGKGRGPAKNLEKLATLGKGHFELISKENIELKLIREAKAKKKK